MASHGGLQGILLGLTKSTDHSSIIGECTYGCFCKCGGLFVSVLTIRGILFWVEFQTSGPLIHTPRGKALLLRTLRTWASNLWKQPLVFFGGVT